MPENLLSVTRAQLSSFLKDPRTIRAFEQAIKSANELLPADVATLTQSTADASTDAAQALAQAAQALDAIERLSNALEMLAIAPVEEDATQVSADIAPPYADIAPAVDVSPAVQPVDELVRTVRSGVYTPTLTNVANLDASTPRQCTWMRVGSVVTVFGQFDADPTATTTLTKLGVSLPVASGLSTAYQLGGIAAAPGVAGQVAGIYADATNDRAEIAWTAVDTTNQTMTFQFSYEVA